MEGVNGVGHDPSSRMFGGTTQLQVQQVWQVLLEVYTLTRLQGELLDLVGCVNDASGRGWKNVGRRRVRTAAAAAMVDGWGRSKVIGKLLLQQKVLDFRILLLHEDSIRS